MPSRSKVATPGRPPRKGSNDLEALTVADLRSRLKAMQIPVPSTWKRSDLLARLRQLDEEGATAGVDDRDAGNVDSDQPALVSERIGGKHAPATPAFNQALIAAAAAAAVAELRSMAAPSISVPSSSDGQRSGTLKSNGNDKVLNNLSLSSLISMGMV